MRLLSRGVTALAGLVAASVALPALAAPAFADDPAPFTCTTVNDAPVATIAEPTGWTLSSPSQWRAGGVLLSTDGSTALTATHTGVFPLAEAAALTADFGTPTTAPGVALAVDFSGTGADGQSAVLTASGATGASTTWTLAPGADATLVDATPADTTATGWAGAFSDAVVHSVSYALPTGGGAADATLASVTADCVRYTFGLASLGTPTVKLGAAKVGVTLTPEVSGWAATPDSVAYAWTIGSTTAGTATYKPATGDVDKKLTLTVTGTKAGYATASSDPTAPTASTVVASTDFVGSPNPTLSGTVRVGSKVRAVLGPWSPSPTAVAYQWRIDGKAVAGATASSFVPRATDRGHQLSVAVTATLPGYTKAVRTSGSAPVGYGVFSAAKPTISGSSQVGSTLTAHRGTWTPSGASYSYRWLRSGSPISGATKSTYKVKTADRGKSISVRVTGKAPGYTTKVVTSSSVKATVPFKATHAPTITGTPRVSSTLTAHVSAWSPTAKLHYQWKRDGKAISGATHSTYKLVRADHGARITVSVKGTRSGYTTKTRTSKRTASIAWPKGVSTPKITKQPKSFAGDITGKATFKVAATGGALHYQWQYSSDGAHTWHSLTGKTASTLTFTITGSKSLYWYRVVVSNVVKSVTSKPALLAVRSTPRHAFGPDDTFLLVDWVMVTGPTTDRGQVEGGGEEDVIATPAEVCYLGSGTVYPGSVLDIRLHAADGTEYTVPPGSNPDNIDQAGALRQGGCVDFTMFAAVPRSALTHGVLKGGFWDIADYSEGEPFSQFVRVS